MEEEKTRTESTLQGHVQESFPKGSMDEKVLLTTENDNSKIDWYPKLNFIVFLIRDKKEFNKARKRNENDCHKQKRKTKSVKQRKVQKFKKKIC